MRTCIKNFSNVVQQTLMQTSTNALLTPITEDKANERITVGVSYVDQNGDEVGKESYIIEGSNYDLIMSANPTFAPDKPENEYREDDLWYILRTINPDLPDKH